MIHIDHKEIIKRYNLLPKVLQEIIFSEKSADIVGKTCVLREVEKHTSIIARLAGRVLLGYLRPELFALEIQKETGMDMQKAQLIAQDLDAEIFSAVRLELKKLYPPTIQTPTVQTWRAESQPTPAPSASSGQAKPRYVIPIPEKFLRQSADVAKFNVARSDLQQPMNKTTPVSDSKTDSSGGGFKSAGGGPTSQQTEVKPQPTPAPDSKTNSSGNNLKSAGGDQVSQKPADQYGETRSPTTGSIDHPEVNRLQITPQINVSQQAETKSQEPVFKPIVPLPTFIQTQFRTTQVNSQKSESQKDDAVSAPLSDDPQIKNLISKFTSSSTQKPKPPAESPYREKV